MQAITIYITKKVYTQGGNYTDYPDIPVEVMMSRELDGNIEIHSATVSKDLQMIDLLGRHVHGFYKLKSDPIELDQQEEEIARKAYEFQQLKRKRSLWSE